MLLTTQNLSKLWHESRQLDLVVTERDSMESVRGDGNEAEGFRRLCCLNRKSFVKLKSRLGNDSQTTSWWLQIDVQSVEVLGWVRTSSIAFYRNYLLSLSRSPQHNVQKNKRLDSNKRRKMNVRSFVFHSPIKVFKNAHKSYLRLFISSYFSLVWINSLLHFLSFTYYSEMLKRDPKERFSLRNINAVWCTIFLSFNKLSYLFSMKISHEEFHKLLEDEDFHSTKMVTKALQLTLYIFPESLVFHPPTVAFSFCQLSPRSVSLKTQLFLRPRFDDASEKPREESFA